MKRLKDLDAALHSIPELGLEEYKTCAFIRKTLDEDDIAYLPVINTGTLVYIEGESKDIICFRADIDALNIADTSNHISRSKHSNFSHACGHSGHTAALLETILSTYEKIRVGKILKKSLLFIFQPGEEGFAGARSLIKDENFVKFRDRISSFFATHLNPDIDEGSIATRSGYLSAQNINLKWDIEGKGCHGAYPHTGIDIIVATANLISSYQTISSRNIHPDEMFLLTIGKFLSGSKVGGVFIPGGARNIIPNNIEMEGTIRLYDPKNIDISKRRLEAINRGFEEAYEMKIDMIFKENYPPMYNDEKLYLEVNQTIEELGIPLYKAPRMTGSEDFSFYHDIAPTFMFFTGIKNEKLGHTHSLHNPKFGYDSSALINIVRVYEKLIG